MQPCKCGCLNFTDIQLDGSVHYAKRICSKCHKFIQWIPNPNITIDTQNRTKVIENLLKQPLTSWEIFFLNSLKGRRYLTPKQLEKLESIRHKNTPI